MRGLLVRSPFASLLVLGVAACASASGDVKGGEARFDAAPPDPLVVPISEPTYEDAPETSWRGIYRDFFGRRAKGSCAGNGTCHGAADKAGAKVSNFVCADLEGCYQSLRTAKDPDPRVSMFALVEDKDIAAPDSAYLFSIVRYRAADGSLVSNRGMPQLPADYAYSAAEIDRMKAWIKAGAKND
jgi:hypothetical protein